MIRKKMEARLALTCALAVILAAGSALASTRVGFTFTNLAPLDEGMRRCLRRLGRRRRHACFHRGLQRQRVRPDRRPRIRRDHHVDFETGLDLAEVTDIKVTLEPPADADPAPSGLIVLGGAVAGMTALLTTGLDSVAEAMAAFILATPSDNPGMPDNNDMGIWFLTAPGPEPGFMNLPDLGSAWVYEGWVVDLSGPNPVPYSTGTFTQASGADSDMAGPMGGGPAVPWPGLRRLPGWAGPGPRHRRLRDGDLHRAGARQLRWRRSSSSPSPG